VGQDNVDLLRKLYNCLERGDFATAEFFDPDIEFVRYGGDAAGLPGEFHGIDAMWATMVEWLQGWENYRVTATRFVDFGDRVLVFDRQTARGKHSGLAYDRELGQIFDVRAGKIVRWESYWDVADAVRAVGLEE
jgi:hypothetical protein